MKVIPLICGEKALVDDEDYDFLIQWNWRCDSDGCVVRTSNRIQGKQHRVYMHREILGLCYRDGKEIDHKDCNQLNNMKKNLRVCSRTQNNQNRRKQKNGTSQYKGVSWHKGAQKWIAGIVVGKKREHLGYYSLEECAAIAYDFAAVKHFGEFARINF